jgi:hypothetical protein
MIAYPKVFIFVIIEFVNPLNNYFDIWVFSRIYKRETLFVGVNNEIKILDD